MCAIPFLPSNLRRLARKSSPRFLTIVTITIVTITFVTITIVTIKNVTITIVTITIVHQKVASFNGATY